MSENTIALRTDEPEHMPVAATPMGMIERALSTGASVETIQKLMELQERWEANQARKAFDAAISAAKAEIRPVGKNAKGHNDKRYADFFAVTQAVDEILARNGLYYRYEVNQTDRINVTCVLSHVGGHSVRTTLSGPADVTGNKNAVQAIGSTLSYLERYSLMAALGLSVAPDDDGRGAGQGDTVTDSQRDRIFALIDETQSDISKFCSVFGIASIAEMPAKEFKRAVTMLESKKRKASGNA